MFFLILYYIIVFVQELLGYGTAYRLTKRGGDNGASLVGWLIVTSLASAVPGLGFYLWRRYRDKEDE